MANNKRNAKVELTLDKDRFDRGLDAAGRKLRKFARDGSRALGDLDKSTASMVGGLGKKLGGQGLRAARAGLKGIGLAAAVGGIGVVSMASDVLDLEKALTRFEIKTRKSQSDMADFRSELSEVSRASGINRAELLAGADGYVEVTGDAKGAAAAMRVFADVSNATGADMADIANVAAAMKDGLRLDPKDFKAGFSAFAAMGDEGSVGLAQAAAELPNVAAKFRDFNGGTGVGGLVELGAAFQIAASGGTSAGEAATQFEAAIGSMKRKAKEFRRYGVQIFDKDPKTGARTMRNFTAIMKDLRKSKLALDPAKLIKVTGTAEAADFLSKMLKDMQRFEDIKRAGSDTGYIDRNAAKYLDNPAVRASKAWNNVKNKAAEIATPERIERLANATESVVSGIEDFVDGVQVAAAIMGGSDSKLFDSRILATFDKYNARANAAAGQPMPAFAVPSIGHFKTNHPGTTTDTPLIREWEGIGRDIIGRSRDYDLGALLGFTSSATAERGQTARMGGLTAQGPMAPSTMAAPSTPNQRPIVMTADVVVQVDGQAIARASANAASHRGAPGGR